MNPKSTANLDPKLREAYERIMGTTVPQAQPGQTPPQSTAQTPPPTPDKPASPLISEKPDDPITPFQPLQTPKLQVQEIPQEPLSMQTPDLPFPPKPEPVSGEMVQSPQSPVFNSKTKSFTQEPVAQPSETIGIENTNAISPKKGRKLIPILLTLGGLVFFVTYGVIWAKVFGLF